MNYSTRKVKYQKPVLMRFGTVVKATRKAGTSSFFNSIFVPGDLIQGSSGSGGDN